MKQYDMFGNSLDETEEDKKYTKKVESPKYSPRNKKPHIMELIDREKARRLLREIKASNVTEEEKDFLMNAASRHFVFHYEKIADYYANSSKEMQHLMEKNALVIIDFQKAIEYGYMQLSEKVIQQYLKDYPDE